MNPHVRGPLVFAASALGGALVGLGGLWLGNKLVPVATPKITAQFHPDKLADHFARHGGDFGVKSAAKYQKIAQQFLTGRRAAEVLEKTRANGDIIRFDPRTDTFGVLSRNGTIRTFYKPDPAIHGYQTNLDYFNAQ